MVASVGYEDGGVAFGSAGGALVGHFAKWILVGVGVIMGARRTVEWISKTKEKTGRKEFGMGSLQKSLI